MGDNREITAAGLSDSVPNFPTNAPLIRSRPPMAPMETPAMAQARGARMIWRLILVYVFLLIFEGVARKWLLPRFSAPLLVVRDPVLLGIYWYALRARLLPMNGWMISLIALAVLSFCAGIFAEHGQPAIALFGVHTNFLHFPLAFVMARICDRPMILAIGRFLLLVALPLGLLMVVQFRSPPDAWINAASSESGRQFAGALGTIRPAATFSFHTGAAEFFTLVSAFLIYAILEKRTFGPWLIAAGGSGLLLGMSVAVSRFGAASIAIVFGAALVIALLRMKYLPRLLALVAVLAILFAALLPFGVLQEGTRVFSARIEHAAAVEGGAVGFGGRVARGFLEPATQLISTPLLGHGLGLGTNVGAVLRTGTGGFVLSEDEWMRILLESGPILGSFFLLWRAGFFLALFAASLRALATGNILPLLLFAACCYLVVNGHLGRSTTLGFAVLGAGLCLGALRVPENDFPARST